MATKHDALIRHLEAERDDLVGSPGDGHPERVAEITEQLKSLGVDTGEWTKLLKAERGYRAAEVEAIREASGDAAADHSPAATLVAKLDAHLDAAKASRG